MAFKTKDGFLELLRVRYGSVVRGWNQCLDVSGDGRLSFTEFTQGCRNIGFAGSVKKLWAELDTDGSGIITLQELDVEVYDLLENFRSLVRDKSATCVPQKINELNK